MSVGFSLARRANDLGLQLQDSLSDEAQDVDIDIDIDIEDDNSVDETTLLVKNRLNLRTRAFIMRMVPPRMLSAFKSGDASPKRKEKLRTEACQIDGQG